jgi:hypothetical protein
VSVKSTFDRNRAFLSFALLLGSKEQFKYVFKIKSTHNHAALKSFICFFNEKGGLDCHEEQVGKEKGGRELE